MSPFCFALPFHALCYSLSASGLSASFPASTCQLPHFSFPLALSLSEPHLGRPPLDELLQVRPGGDAEDEAAVLVGDDGKVLLLAGGLGALEEGLELLQGRVHGDDAVAAAPALEAVHGGAKRVGGGDAAGVEEGLQLGDGDVAEEGAGLGVYDGEVGVVALEGEGEGEGDGVGGVEGEGGGGLEVLDGGLVARGEERGWLA